MKLAEQPTLAQITYRATVTGGCEAEIRILADPATASLADAWARFTALHAEVDPRSLEIEIRELVGPVPVAGDARIGGRQAAKPEASRPAGGFLTPIPAVFPA